MKKIQYSFISINYNGKKINKNFIDSYRLQPYKFKELIFVNSLSVDGSWEALETYTSEDKDIKLLDPKKNLGYGVSNNLAAKQSRGDYLIFVNNDVILPENFLNTINDFVKVSQDVDIIGFPEADYITGMQINSGANGMDLLGHQLELKSKDTKKYFYYSGFCLVVKKSIFEELDGFDANFFMYVEEVDFFWRAYLRKKNTSLLAMPIRHYGSASSDVGRLKPKIFRWRNLNALQMLCKNYSWYNLVWSIPLYILQNFIEIIFFLILGKFKVVESYLHSYYDFFKIFPNILKERKKVQNTRLTGDLEILKKMTYAPAKAIHLFKYISKR